MAAHNQKPGALSHGRTTGGLNVPILVATDGTVATSASGGGGGDASAANQATEITALNKLAAQTLDYDSGAGTATQNMVGLSLPASGGPVGVSATNPLPVTSRPNAMWATNHAPAANNKATITKASAGGNLKNVCTGFTVALAAGSTAPAAIQISVALIDGAAGGTTYLWGPTVISLPAVAGAVAAFAFGQRWDVGTAATAMTLEFSAAGGANTIESVSMNGTTTL